MHILLTIFLLLLPPIALADGLPDLGDLSQVDFSPALEQRTGDMIMRDIRLYEPGYIDDPEINGYLNRLGLRLLAKSNAPRQDFDFFALRDPSLNAFAMPGGYIGVHTGLITATHSESELASVLAHEISHVTQHHLARQISSQAQGQLPMLLALAVAILASRSNSDLAQGALMTGQAASIQHQLNYSRDFEREADRLGLQLLEDAGFDVRAMVDFFERLQKYGRLYESNAPGYLRTHPLTSERIADMANRIHARPYRQVTDSLEYQLVRSKLRASEGSPQDAVTEFSTQIREHKYSNEIAARYGLAAALLRTQDYSKAEQEIARLRTLKASSPMIESLAADLRKKQHDLPAALKLLRAARTHYPQERSIAYSLADTLLTANQATEALQFVQDDLQDYPHDARMFGLLARTYAVLGNPLQQHRAQAEAYALQGQLLPAIEQLQLAQKLGDHDYFEQSKVDARLRELKQQHAEEMKETKGK
ncbi:MAG: M48 family metalloprotease [Sterolibacterium sp.]|nr:M48 family metalloprotease [Sterolibacterium sp.]